jgi:SpoIID/LytB domain protein
MTALRSPIAVALFPVSLLGLALAVPLLGQAQSQAQSQGQALNPQMNIGVVQRFGTKVADKLTIVPQSGNKLAVTIRSKEKLETIQTDRVVLDIQPKVFSEPQVQERLVLSSHRSFESAEDSANQWRAKGLTVEIAQPERWEVWAKRSVYTTPLVRRTLLEDLRKNGFVIPYLDAQTLKQQPKASLLVNGFRYNRDEVDIKSNGLITVDRATLPNDNPTPRTPYPGSLRLQPNTYGTYTLVNRVTIEDYLRGVVPHEIGSGAPAAAVEAQAVLARTYALRNLRRFAIDDYELCADTQCQVYFGWRGTVPEADRAIANTKGLVMTYGGELIDAVYSSTTGGVTAAFTDVWNGAPRPYLQPVVDAVGGSWNLKQDSLATEQNLRRFLSQKQGFNEVGWPNFRWRNEATLPRLTKDLRSYLVSKKNPLATFKSIQSIAVQSRAAGGRVQKLMVVTDAGSIGLEKDEVIRAFDAPNSLLFYLDPLLGANKSLQGYAFIGGGLGHGVGLSQTGSYRLATLGWNNGKILSFYYPGAKLQPLDNKVTYWTEPVVKAIAKPAG